jgi:hypothetical protein
MTDGIAMTPASAAVVFNIRRLVGEARNVVMDNDCMLVPLLVNHSSSIGAILASSSSQVSIVSADGAHRSFERAVIGPSEVSITLSTYFPL